MIVEKEFVISPEVAFNQETLTSYLKSVLKVGESDDFSFNILRRSIDARKVKVKVNLKVQVAINEELLNNVAWSKSVLQNVENAEEVIIVGAGPAGLFAAIRAIELGLKPIVLERGKDVQARRRDLAAINKDHIVNPNSNYCFGEGGAGTYSDGKLYTRSKKRGDIRRVLEIMVKHGAREEILFDAHPHIGTNKLPKLIEAIRETITECGGQVLFDQCVTDLIIEGEEIKGVTVNNNTNYKGISVLLATGHSARDIFTLLQKRNVAIEAKPFALGVRVEHQQGLIDQIQYKCEGDRGEYLPAASYSLVHQAKHKGKQVGVFSFCMCPGGFIVPSATSPGEIVVNGMSPSKRDSKFSNSGIVVAVDQNDFQQYAKYKELAGMMFQADIEKKAFEIAGGTQAAPTQRLVDFTKGRVSSSLLDSSYQPGLVSSDLNLVLPPKVSNVLKQGFKSFGKKMNGYYSNEAQILGVESRTSSPVKIPRDKETLEHIGLGRLFPCAEGAGYAGGIMSAAMDGERCMEQIAQIYKK